MTEEERKAVNNEHKRITDQMDFRFAILNFGLSIVLFVVIFKIVMGY